MVALKLQKFLFSPESFFSVQYDISGHFVRANKTKRSLMVVTVNYKFHDEYVFRIRFSTWYLPNTVAITPSF